MKMVLEMTDHSDCPMWTSEGSLCGVKCPDWYKHKTGGHRLARRGLWNMRRPRKCPAKNGILIKLKG